MSTVEIAARRKKTHKPRQKTLTLWNELKAIVDRYSVISVRGVYYQAETAGLVGKTEADYEKVQRALLQMRRQDIIPYDKVIDNSRERRGVPLYTGMYGALAHMQRIYRRDYWQTQPVHVEIWCEKDALTPIFTPICNEYGVTFCAIKGFDSESFTYVCAKEIKRTGKPAHIFYFGDHDPSGWWIARNLEPNLRDFGVDATVDLVALNPWMIERFRLPTRHAKPNDSRRAGFVEHFGSDLCCEVDAVDPATLQELTRRCIETQIKDREQWKRMQDVEAAEHETLSMLPTYLSYIESSR